MATPWLQKDRAAMVYHGSTVVFIAYLLLMGTSVINVLFSFCKQLLCNLP